MIFLMHTEVFNSNIKTETYNKPMGELGTKRAPVSLGEIVFASRAQGPVKLEYKNDAVQRGLRTWTRPTDIQSLSCAAQDP